MKYIKLLSALVLLLVSFFSKAQTTTFEREFTGFAFNPYVIENKDGQFLMSRRIIYQDTFFYDELSLLNNKGEILKTTTIPSKDSTAINELIVTDTGYIAFGSKYDTGLKQYRIWVAKLDKQLNIISSISSDSVLVDMLLYSAVLHKNNLYFVGVKNFFKEREPFIGKYDFEEKLFTVNDTLRKNGHGVTELLSEILSFNDRLIINGAYQISDSLKIIAKPPYTFVDSSDPPSDEQGELLKYSNTEYLIMGYNRGFPPFNLQVMKVKYPYTKKQNVFLGKVDTNETPALFHALSFKDKNSIYVGGISRYAVSVFGIDSWFMLANLDSLLKPRWVRYFGGDNTYILHGVIATDDGGCLMYGTKEYKINNLYESRTYLLKVNNKGELVGEDNIPISNLSVKAYPNPAHTTLHLNSIEAMQNVRVSDIQGRIVYAQRFTVSEDIHYKTLNIEAFSNGLYSVLVQTTEGTQYLKVVVQH